MNRHTKTRGAPRSHPTSIEKSRKKRHQNGSKRPQTKKENDKSGHGKDKERGRLRSHYIYPKHHESILRLFISWKSVLIYATSNVFSE